MLNPPLTVRDQFDAVVSSVPVKPVMSILAMVVAPASVVVPVGLPLKIALFVAGTTRTADTTQSVLFPSVQVMAVPGLGMLAPAPQRLKPEAVHCVGAIP